MLQNNSCNKYVKQIILLTQLTVIYMSSHNSPLDLSFSILEHITHLEVYIATLEKLSSNCRDNGEEALSNAFSAFAELSKELLTPMKNMVCFKESALYSIFSLW